MKIDTPFLKALTEWVECCDALSTLPVMNEPIENSTRLWERANNASKALLTEAKALIAASKP